MSSSRGISVLEVLIVIVVLVILVSLLFPAVSGPPPDSSRKAQAKNDVVQIATAVNAFETEYGRLPGTNSGGVGGEVLATLLGSNTTLNPRKIVFLEVNTAKKGKSGLSNGNFVDPWGGIYQIAYANGANHKVTVGTNGIEIKKKVGVWSDPDLGTEGWGWKASKKERRYVTSWD